MNSLFRALVALALVVSVASPMLAQTEEEVLEPIHQLFDGMRAGDPEMVTDAFVPIARLVRTGTQDGKPSHRVMQVSEFAEAVGRPTDRVWDEKIWDIKLEVRDNLASAWMKFAFFAGDEFSHCGVNSAELVRTENGWKIFQLSDTSQREDCEMPPESAR